MLRIWENTEYFESEYHLIIWQLTRSSTLERSCVRCHSSAIQAANLRKHIVVPSGDKTSWKVEGRRSMQLNFSITLFTGGLYSRRREGEGCWGIGEVMSGLKLWICQLNGHESSELQVKDGQSFVKILGFFNSIYFLQQPPLWLSKQKRF